MSQLPAKPRHTFGCSRVDTAEELARYCTQHHLDPMDYMKDFGRKVCMYANAIIKHGDNASYKFWEAYEQWERS